MKGLNLAKSKAEVFGQFSYPHAWQVLVPCKFDEFTKCFKTDPMKIKRGHKFKFRVTLSYEGKKSQVQYLTSESYEVVTD